MVRTGVILTFTIICAVIAWTDIQKQKIYNETVAVLLVPAIVSFFVFPEISIMSRFLGAVSVSGIMLIVGLIIPGAFGGGDIKMMVPVGVFLGFERTLAAGVLALCTGAFGCIVLFLRSMYEAKVRKGCKEICKEKFAFGPALCLGSITALIWGDSIFQWIIGN